MAAWLGKATTVHMPLVGLRSRDRLLSAMVPWDEPEKWAYHDPRAGDSHGRVVGNAVVWPSK